MGFSELWYEQIRVRLKGLLLYFSFLPLQGKGLTNQASRAIRSILQLVVDEGTFSYQPKGLDCVVTCYTGK